MREILLKVWLEANELETKRVKGIQTTYEEMIKANKGIYTEGILG